MRLVIILVFTIIISTPMFSQETNIDSLNNATYYIKKYEMNTLITKNDSIGVSLILSSKSKVVDVSNYMYELKKESGLKGDSLESFKQHIFKTDTNYKSLKRVRDSMLIEKRLYFAFKDTEYKKALIVKYGAGKPPVFVKKENKISKH